VKPQQLIDRSTTPDGKELVLYQRDGVYTIRVDGLELMSSRAHGSEEAMARLALAGALRPAAEVLIGGLGMGYTLRAVLDRVPGAASVTVAELLPVVVRWNRQHLAGLAGSPLDDPRVALVEDDVGSVIAGSTGRFDAVLLDVDNGPAALTVRGNERLYRAGGLAAAHRCLRPGGVLAVWSAGPDAAFERALRRAGFEARAERVSARDNRRGPHHTVFVATRAFRRDR
jgi:spermidine synthase